MAADVLAPTPENVQRAAAHLRGGGVVGMPTETVYGLAAIAFDERALARVFAVKDRPTFDPLIVHVAAPDPQARATDELARAGVIDPVGLGPGARERVDGLARRFWPGPLTLVLPKSPRVPDLATAGLEWVGVRAPAHPVARALIDAAGAPLAAPSANRFGRISPTTARAVVEELGERIELVLDGGPCAVGVESTVLRVDPDGALELLRPGGVPVEAIEAAAGVPVRRAADERGDRAQHAPGRLESHYAPARPLTLLDGPVRALSPEQARALCAGAPGVGLLAYQDAGAGAHLAALAGVRVVARVLAPGGEAEEAARRLFGLLRELDAVDVTRLVAEPPPTTSGLGLALLDRLRRASAARSSGEERRTPR